MSKVVTISSLVRQAAKSEAEFHAIMHSVFAEEPFERVAEFFDRLNIPRSVEGDNFDAPLDPVDASGKHTLTFDQEHLIHTGIQKYMERHLKKLKWHAARPSTEGSRNVLLLMREGMSVTDLRLQRIQSLLRSKDELTAVEWAKVREMINRAYLAFRNFLVQTGGAWIDAVSQTLDRDELEGMLGSYYELIDATIRQLEAHRNRIEERRMELTVCPEGFDPVKPPIYFGGDLLGRGPWKQYWSTLEDRAHHFREALS